MKRKIIEQIKKLVEDGADIYVENDFALKWAIMNGYLEIVEFLESIIKIEKNNENQNRFCE